MLGKIVFVLSIFYLANSSLGMFDGLKKFVANPIDTVMFSNKCIEDLGCFYTGPPYFHPIYRPISLAPSDADKMKTNFWLYTPREKTRKFNLKPTEESINASTFDQSLQTKFLVHGYLATMEENDSRHRMKDAFLEEGDYNVIIVDWTSSNGRPYFQAVANTRVVGAQIARLINVLEETRGITPQSVHIVGHSLGSHIAGYAGERVPNLGRITGIDPAGPSFCGTDVEVRLDPTDAEFVDVIHTNMGKLIVDGLGISEPIGDVDFFPNGAEHQPICKPVLVNITVAGLNVTAVGSGEGATALMATSCDHNAGNEYFIASIRNKNCTFVGTECGDYEEYEHGGCTGNRKAIMGYQAHRDPNIKHGMKFYLDTTDTYPYCVPENVTEANPA